MKKQFISFSLLLVILSSITYSQSYYSQDIAELLQIDAYCDANNQLNWNIEIYPALYNGRISWAYSPNRVTQIYLDSYQLTGTMNVSNLIRLMDIYCPGNQLTNLILGYLPELHEISYTNNYISNIDLSGVPNLEYLRCENNGISNLDLTPVSNLLELYCNNNNISNLNVVNLERLILLCCGSNDFTELNVNNLENLRYLDFSFSDIFQIDISNLANLETLICANGELTSLDMSNNQKLQKITLDNNRLPFSSLGTGLHDNVTIYNYSPQKTLYEPQSYTYNFIINYSSEALINGESTTFCFYKGDSIIETNTTGIYTTQGSGIYHCEMTNPLFPELRLYTATITIDIPLYLTVSPGSLDFSANAGSGGEFIVLSNTDWTLSCLASWLTYSPATGSNNNTIVVTASANHTIFARTATITATGVGVVSQSVVVIQNAPIPATITDLTFENPILCGETGKIIINLLGSEDGDIFDIDYDRNGETDNRGTTYNNIIVLTGVPNGTDISALTLTNIITTQQSSTNLTGTITNPVLPDVSLSDIGPYCTNIQPQVLEGGLPEGGQYSIDGKIMKEINPLTFGEGTHQIIYTYSSSNNCSNSDTVKLLIFAEPVVEITGDQNLCPGTEGAIYIVQNYNQYIYSWDINGGTYTTDSQDSEIKVNWSTSQEGTIRLAMHSDVTQCSVFSSLKVNLMEYEDPKITECISEYTVISSVYEDELIYELGAEDKLLIPSATDNCPADNLSYNYSFNGSEYHNVEEFEGYRLSGSDINTINWQITDISGNEAECATTIYFDIEYVIPTAFSPNNDELNNTWNIQFLSYYPNCEVKVFNRWGILIYKSEKGYPESWDGNRNGRLVPVDTYYYVIDLGSESKIFKGYVTVLY